MVTLTGLLASLPPEPNEASLFAELQQEVAGSQRKLVVIDDDPTGTQTVHDIELLTTWNKQMLVEALQNESRLFYLLTNARSMPESEAVQLNHETAQQLAAASEETKIAFVVASRSDSTLRGHYPAEIQALESGFTPSGGDSFDGHLVVPAFFEGGRYTMNETYYVATPTANSDTLQPASETSFARDSVFGYRTAASFVRLRGAVERKPPLETKEIMRGTQAVEGGGIVIVGSYVPDSSAQLENVLTLSQVIGIELPVERVIRNAAESETISRAVGQQLEAAIKAGRVGVLYTSRRLVTSANRTENLEIGNKVSHALIAALRQVKSRPRFIVAKGGITSHDVAQKALGCARARVLGQLFPGVPVWRLESGLQSRFEGVPYIVFPGNVGGPESLMQAVKLLSDE
jgi:uncharacterized protein YgbK (DUF1537 family)